MALSAIAHLLFVLVFFTSAGELHPGVTGIHEFADARRELRGCD